jgi:preprotein translocase subunit SecG
MSNNRLNVNNGEQNEESTLSNASDMFDRYRHGTENFVSRYKWWIILVILVLLLAYLYNKKSETSDSSSSSQPTVVAPSVVDTAPTTDVSAQRLINEFFN